MVLTVADYRAYAGLLPTDPPTDPEIQRALARYEVLVGSYLGRQLAPARRVESFYFTDRSPVILGYWPLLKLNGVYDETGQPMDTSKLVLHHTVGLIYHGGAFCNRKVTVDYDAGFNPLPEDIALVVLTLAEAFLAGAGGGAAALNQAPVKSETVYGVSSITYDTSLLVKQEDSGTSGQTTFPELGPYVAVLNKYRGQYRYV